ncbi:MAG: carbamoyltransferase C-terminal domain-containing protein, partial [Bacteroidota bacterium]
LNAPTGCPPTAEALLYGLLQLQKKIKRTGKTTRNLCMAGGCALNIKWNSAIRNAGFMDEVYVPPFPNDSGSALGMAILEYYRKTGKWDIDWSVYSGPAIEVGDLPAGWEEKDCSLQELAQLLHDTQEPVVFLNGNAELGPRALGNRSIIGAPGEEGMKGILNKIKQREAYRPVSPMCLEHRAPQIFEPGSPDPFMLFDHQIRPEWESKIRAVRHLDNSARLQTISEKHNFTILELLTEYEKISGIPVLCNTSANFKGTGFFPNVQSALEWNGTRFVWSNGILYTKKA